MPKVDVPSDLPRVEIHWIDSEGDEDGGWLPLTNIKPEITPCVTVGQLIHGDDETVTVVGTLDCVNGHYLGRITIPKVAITEMIILCPDRSAKASRPRRTRASKAPAKP